MMDSDREEMLASMLAGFMNEQASDSEYRTFLATGRGQAETGFSMLGSGKPSPKMFGPGKPSAKAIRKLIGTAFALGHAVGADGASISGGFPAGISIGVSFALPKKGNP